MDITWTDAAGSFKYRAAAVIRDGDRLLVCAVDHIDGWFLPGGKVRFGESSATALVRELCEELGVEFAVTGPPLLITEGIRTEDGVLHQEVCFYYEPHGRPPEAVTELTGHRFGWMEITNLQILPPEIAGHLAGPSAGLRAGSSAGLGAGLNAGLGAGSSAGLRAGPNTGLGVGPSAGRGAGLNAGLGAGSSAGPGAGPSAGLGAGPSAGPGAGPSAEPSAGPGPGPSAEPTTGPRHLVFDRRPTAH